MQITQIPPVHTTAPLPAIRAGRDSAGKPVPPVPAPGRPGDSDGRFEHPLKPEKVGRK